MDQTRLDSIFAFLKQTAALKDTLRSAHTQAGNRESSAEHSWHLCLMALLLSSEFEDVDAYHLVKLCIVHDLAEAVVGDIAAPDRGAIPDKDVQERAAMEQLCSVLPDDLKLDLLGIWEEYEAGVTPAAIIAKGLDKLETIHQHTIGLNPATFDYAFNLNYGRDKTDKHPVLAQIREKLDEATIKFIK